MLTLAHALRSVSPQTIAIVGAGGKTSALFNLGRTISPCVVSTTTHIAGWEARLADRHLVWHPDRPWQHWPAGDRAGITLVTGPLDPATNRHSSMPVGAFAALRRAMGAQQLPILVEADGSRQLPLKAPAAHEPVIPAESTAVFVVAGASGLGRPLTSEHVHRPDLFGRLGAIAIGDTIDGNVLARVLSHAAGGLKDIPARARRIALLNQADTPGLVAQLTSMVAHLLPVFHAVVIARLAAPGAPGVAGDVTPRVLTIHERVAGIVLAAGASTRFGRPKQLLEFRGNPFVRVATQTALAAGLSPVHVVTGAHAGDVEASLAGLPVTIARNPAWQRGQGTSVRAGVERLPVDCGAAVFLLADQPQVSPELVRALVLRHAQGLFPVVATRAAGRRTSPLLFDRVTFDALTSLDGDVGGRAVASRYAVEEVYWSDPRVAVDVDTPDDYARLEEGAP